MTVYSKEIVDVDMADNDLNAGPDKIFRAQTLPDTTSLASDAFRHGNLQGGNEIKVVTEDGGTLVGNLTVEIKSSATEDGTFTTVPGGTFITALGAVEAGAELARYIAPKETTDMWFKVSLTTASTETMKVESYIVWVGR